MLDKQIALITRLDDRAAQVMATAAAVVGFMVAGLGLVPRSLDFAALLDRGGTAVAAMIVLVAAGFALLAIAIVLAGSVFLRLRVAIGLAPEVFRAVLRANPSSDEYLRASLQAYAAGIEANRRLQRDAGRRLRTTIVLVGSGMLSGTAGIAGLIWVVLAS